ncbi:MAG: hypothetical protein K6G83_03750 [Lachnospiraceae bacterium]|nr:hypothetical protein [Lachnospiraceae bacterium]
MLRYCENCKKEFEFSPLAVSGKDPIFCPECGNEIDKKSRWPAEEDRAMAEKNEEGMGKAVEWLFRFCYLFYLILGILGVIGFVTGAYGLLFFATFLSVAAYILQFATGTVVFTSGVIFLPAGAIAGFLLFGGIAGACLGIHIVFLIRHVVRDIVYALIIKLIRMGADS